MCSHLPFREVWAVDFEFGQDSNLNPEVRCMVARELRSRRTLRLWYDELHGLTEAPFSCGAGALFIAYYSSAELGCFLSLGWSLPVNVADLFVEFRCATNGTLGAKGAAKLTGALSYFGLDAVSATEKEEMRRRWSGAEANCWPTARPTWTRSKRCCRGSFQQSTFPTRSFAGGT
jgi:hypothetical protein